MGEVGGGVNWFIYFCKLVPSVSSNDPVSSSCDSKLHLNRAIVGFFLEVFYFLNYTQLCLPMLLVASAPLP